MYHKQSEDSVMSLGNMDIMFHMIIVSWPKWGVVAAAIFNVLHAENTFGLVHRKDWAFVGTSNFLNLQIDHNHINED